MDSWKKAKIHWSVAEKNVLFLTVGCTKSPVNKFSNWHKENVVKFKDQLWEKFSTYVNGI